MTDVALKQKHTYVEAGKKLEDASSTAWSFMFLSIIGFAALILIWAGIFPLDIPFAT